MYFASDYPSPVVARQIMNELREINAAHPSQSTNVFVLIDGAFDEDFLDRHFRRGFPRISLYEGTALSGMGKAAPFLVEVNESKTSDALWLEKLLHAAGNSPMWSIIVATANMQALAKHFSPYLIAKSEDSLEWPVRWADTRILPQLLNAFETELVEELMLPIYSWFAPSRTGELLRWIGKGGAECRAPENEKLPMSDAVFKKLIDGSEPDMILSRIYDIKPDLLKSRLPSKCYQLVRQQLKIADHFHIDQMPARQHLSTMSLFLRDGFSQMLEFRILLEGVRNGADYMLAIEALSGSFWQEASV
jgi:hypothetical protein